MLRAYAKGALQSLRLRVRPAGEVDLDRVAGPDSPRRRHSFVPEPQRVAEFCRVVHEPVGNTVPVTYLHAAAFGESVELMSASHFPLPLVGMVHIANSVTQHRPVQLGEPVTAMVWIEALRAHAKGTEVVVATRFEVDGEVRVEERSTMLAKGVRVPGAAEAPVRPREEFSPGPPTMLWSFSPADATAYARVSGDRNPIHLNAVAAKAFGFPRRIAHGMYTAARGLASAQVRTRAFGWEVEFAAPVLLPGKVAVRLEDTAGALTVNAWNPKRGKPHMLSRIEPLTTP